MSRKSKGQNAEVTDESSEKHKNNTMKIEITIYDCNPAQSGPCAWPDTFSGRLIGGAISAAAERKIRSAAKACGGYKTGDRLWLIARDEEGFNLVESTIRV